MANVDNHHKTENTGKVAAINKLLRYESLARPKSSIPASNANQAEIQPGKITEKLLRHYPTAYQDEFPARQIRETISTRLFLIKKNRTSKKNDHIIDRPSSTDQPNNPKPKYCDQQVHELYEKRPNTAAAFVASVNDPERSQIGDVNPVQARLDEIQNRHTNYHNITTYHQSYDLDRLSGYLTNLEDVNPSKDSAQLKATTVYTMNPPFSMWNREAAKRRPATSTGTRCNNPHPSREFMVWRIPRSTDIRANSDVRRRFMSAEEYSKIMRGKCRTIYQSDYSHLSNYPDKYGGDPESMTCDQDLLEHHPKNLMAQIGQKKDFSINYGKIPKGGCLESVKDKVSSSRRIHDGFILPNKLKVPVSRFGSSNKTLPADGLELICKLKNSQYRNIVNNTTYDREINERGKMLFHYPNANMMGIKEFTGLQNKRLLSASS